jgi:hypothetical protein
MGRTGQPRPAEDEGASEKGGIQQESTYGIHIDAFCRTGPMSPDTQQSLLPLHLYRGWLREAR